MTTGALDGIVVVDFSRVLAGPYATMMLGDFGAEVIKIERPEVGDDTREWGPPYDSEGVATYFNSVNRNKRSVVLDLADPADVQRARDLVAGADIVVENFRPGTMEKLGLGYDDLRAIRPDVIYCAITGFGRGGGAALPGYDLLVQAVGGLMSVTGTEPGDPTKAGVALVDVLAGLHALSGILVALAHRDRTGEGQRVDTNLFSVLLSSLVNQASGLPGRRRRYPASWATAIRASRLTRPSTPPIGPSRWPSATTSSSAALSAAIGAARTRRGPQVRHQPATGRQSGCVVRLAGTRVEGPRRRPLVCGADCRRRTGRTHQRSVGGLRLRPAARHRGDRTRARQPHASGRQPDHVVGHAGHLSQRSAPARRLIASSSRP